MEKECLLDLLYKRKTDVEVYGKIFEYITQQEARDFLNNFHVKKADIGKMVERALGKTSPLTEKPKT